MVEQQPHKSDNLAELLDQMEDLDRVGNVPQKDGARKVYVQKTAQTPNQRRLSTGIGVTEKRKLKVEIQIGSAHVAVTQPKDLYIAWSRNGK